MTKRNAVALLLGVGAVAASMLNPLTGWLARLELRMLAAPAAPVLADIRAKAPVSPDDPTVQLASGSRTTLPRIATRFPENAAIQATALRVGLERASPGRRPEDHASSNETAPAYVSPEDSDVAALLEQAERGARLEPENAYFPACKMAVLLGANRDDEAWVALHEAATKPHWDEHIADEIRAKWERMERREGRAPALSRVAISASIDYPHYSPLRSLARVVQEKAITRERAGDLQGGLVLRTELMALGTHLRNDASNLIGNLVGMAIHSIATSRLGGVPRVERKRLRQPGESEEALTARVQVIHDAQWDAHVRRLGHLELVGASTKNAAFRLAIKGRMGKVDSISPMGMGRIFGVMKLEAAGLALVLSALWVVLIGGLCQGLARTRRVREGQPLHPGVRAGLWLSVALVPLIGVLVAHAASEEILLLVAVGVGVLVAGTLFFQRRRLVVLLATLGSFCGAFVLCIATGAGVLTLMQGFAGGGGNPVASPKVVELLWSPLILTIPLLTLLGLAIIGWRRRVPASVAVVRGFPKLALPLMALLLLAWAALLIPTAREEASLRVGLDEGIQHEGRMFMKLAGEPWPGDTTK